MYQKDLDPKYFTTIHTEDHHGSKYSIIRPSDNPMILFSKTDGSPLASFHFKCQHNAYQNDNIGNRGQTLITKRPYHSKFKCDFQGLVNKDGQEFELIISNLSEGYINFNILKKDVMVDEVNPGGLNEINELRPYESYAVQCDQTDNGTLILKSIKNEKTGKKLTVGKAESETNSKPTGTYYYISVVPQMIKPELVNKFKDTVWACVDIFCMKKQQQQTYKPTFSHNIRENLVQRNDYFGRRMATVDPVFGSSNTRTFDNFNPTIRNNTFYMPPDPTLRNTTEIPWNNTFDMASNIPDPTLRDTTQHKTWNNPARPEWKKGRAFDMISNIPDPTLRDKSTYKYESEEESADGMDDIFGFSHQAEACKEYEEEEEEEESDDLCGGLDMFSSNSVSKPSKPIQSKIIKDSYAASVTTGRKIQVNSGETGIEYSYDTSSIPCVIGLSISTELNFKNNPPLHELIQLGKLMIQDIIKNASKELLQKLTKIYKATECTICLEGEKDNKPVDSVFYQCGHQCCHYECGNKLNKCPLCRSCITANIKL